MEKTSINEMLRRLREVNPRNYFKLQLQDEGKTFFVNALALSECDVRPDFKSLQDVGWWGAQVRYNDGDTYVDPAFSNGWSLQNHPDDVEFDEEEQEWLYTGSNDSLCLGGNVVVDRGEYYFWRIDEMPEGFIARHEFEEIETSTKNPYIEAPTKQEPKQEEKQHFTIMIEGKSKVGPFPPDRLIVPFDGTESELNEYAEKLTKEWEAKYVFVSCVAAKGDKVTHNKFDYMYADCM